MSTTLPKFDNPPVTETVLSVTFKPLNDWSIPYVGLYWNRVRSQYPRCSIQPPLPDELEKFEERESRQITLSLGPANVRCWYISAGDDWLIQVQNSKFITNWRLREGAKYPNYRGFKEKFEKEWTRFKDFLSNEKLEAPQLVQAEVIYVNHIDIDEGDASLERIFPIWSELRNGTVLKSPSAASINAVYPIGSDQGRLYVAVQPVVRHSDLKDAIQLTLTGRVLIASNSDRDLFDSLKLAHDYVVSGFADFTTPEMHELWKRKQ